MNKWLKTGFIALTLVLAVSTATAAVSPSISVAAAKKSAPARKMDAGVFKKKLAELAKTSNAVKKDQNYLYGLLTQHIEILTGQIGEIFGDPTAAGATEDEMYTFFTDTLVKLSDQDASVQEYFLQDELDQLSSLADRWIASAKQADKLTASYDKLTTTYNSYVKDKKYQEALNVRSQQISLDKKINEVLKSILSVDSDIYSVFDDVLSAQSDVESGSDYSDSGDSYDGRYTDNSVYHDVYR
ncbi:hypothetical protein E5161_09325 [Cohnella pontilimi]|uniref:Uncharacterized protein n=1 Tax=Cohnella pontilimi TaxID=2564100 RepID=A0A4U0FBV3_9BACL|nr:hypothetical protein [Cohnella pontilimi]TJY42200.1 hypothetical protein E5161_09325 [Cohnella pontilimi]